MRYVCSTKGACAGCCAGPFFQDILLTFAEMELDSTTTTVPLHSWLGSAGCGGGGPSPLLAVGPGRGPPPLLVRVRWLRWWWPLATPGCGPWARFPATPGWGPLAVVVGAPPPPPPIWSCWPRPFCGRAAKMATASANCNKAGPTASGNAYGEP